MEFLYGKIEENMMENGELRIEKQDGYKTYTDSTEEVRKGYGRMELDKVDKLHISAKINI